MEEQLKKLKTKSVIVIVLALLAVTWQFLNYLTIRDHIRLDDFSSFEVILIYSSYAFLALLFLALLSLIFTVFRVSMKYRSEKKKDEKQKSALSEETTQISKES